MENYAPHQVSTFFIAAAMVRPMPNKNRASMVDPVIPNRQDSFQRKIKSLFCSRELFISLPCLRCGNWAVVVNSLISIAGRDTFPCRSCEAEHYLSIKREGKQFYVRYNRYTRRYPLDSYDEGDEPEIAMLWNSTLGTDLSDSDSPSLGTFSGPIIIYPRKRRYTQAEVSSIWSSTKGRCHICGHRWRIKERGKRGWHIDHVIPHVGGGPATECLKNLKVACAHCNLRKGRGYTEKQVRVGIQKLIEQFQRWTDIIDESTSENV
ncbi:MAG: HNH endonuclease [Deltaproteobacteria bacterium]|nr:HNH endonuclease [Deltaproteobacteria bacterium]